MAVDQEFAAFSDFFLKSVPFDPINWCHLGRLVVARTYDDPTNFTKLMPRMLTSIHDLHGACQRLY